jgi:GMP synthase-like glutamine amidotransferase
MTVLYVDTEHDRVRDHLELGRSYHARVEATRKRLADAAAAPCLVEHCARVTPTRVERVAPSVVVIGGNVTGWEAYDDGSLAGLLAIIRAAPVPILGICAGHQLIGRAHGAAWGPLGSLRAGEIDPDPAFGTGLRKELGFLPVETDPMCPLFTGVGQPASFFQNHYWQLTETPPGFVTRACSPWCPIQAIQRLDRPVFGVQFHPERYERDHPDGDAVLRNFFAIASPVAQLDRNFMTV